MYVNYALKLRHNYESSTTTCMLPFTSYSSDTVSVERSLIQLSLILVLYDPVMSYALHDCGCVDVHSVAWLYVESVQVRDDGALYRRPLPLRRLAALLRLLRRARLSL